MYDIDKREIQEAIEAANTCYINFRMNMIHPADGLYIILYSCIEKE